MPILKLDLSEAQSLKPIPEDTYPATVSDISGVQEGPKAKYIAAELKISEGDYEGRKFYVNLPIHGKGAGIFADFINKCLGTEYDVDDLEELEIDTDDLLGAEVGIMVKDEEYPEGSGDFRSKVSKVLPKA
jgi:hypothetical protein